MRRLATCAGVTLLLAACGTAPTRPTAPAIPPPPPPPVDLAAIPDPIPRVEPRSKYGNPASYEVFGRRYQLLPTAAGFVERGTASWYGPGFHSARTSSGEPYDMYAMTAAHKTLPIPVYARVTHLGNGRSVIVRINDRGPFVGDRIIDLSYTAAWKLDMLRDGTAPVEVRVLDPAPAAPALSATPVEPAEPTTSEIPPASSSYLQVGAFTDRANAEALVARLAQAGISNVVVRDQQGILRVQIGPIATAAEHEDYLERLRLLGIAEPRRVRE